jgi:hypothetical protein
MNYFRERHSSPFSSIVAAALAIPLLFIHHPAVSVQAALSSLVLDAMHAIRSFQDSTNDFGSFILKLGSQGANVNAGFGELCYTSSPLQARAGMIPSISP